MYFIAPDQQKLSSALEAWNWIGIDGKRPIRVTAFGDVFFHGSDGVWFLDTIEGKFTRVCASDAELEALLATDDGRDRFLLASLVDRAAREGQPLQPGQCYDFKVTPVLGGAISYENIHRQDFEVTLHIAGQIHAKVRTMKPGTEIGSVTIDGAAPTKKNPWWKLW